MPKIDPIHMQQYKELSEKEDKVILILIDKDLYGHILISKEDLIKAINLDSKPNQGLATTASFLLEALKAGIERKREQIKEGTK